MKALLIIMYGGQIVMDGNQYKVYCHTSLNNKKYVDLILNNLPPSQVGKK